MTNRSDTKSKSIRRLELAQSGTARAALLGVSDGLVTNVSLILGVAAAGAPSTIVRLAGLASLIAGACSMSVGEYISMRGQVELLTSILDFEREELESHPKAVHEALEEIMVGDGMSRATAHTASTEVSLDTNRAMSMYARGKLGLNPNELGSAWGSAISSFVMFSLGALVPLIPWFFTGGAVAICISLGLSAVSALGIGVYLGYSTNGKWLHAALRQLLVLIIAASATYLIGRLFHSNVT